MDVYPEQREKAGKHATGEAVEGEAWSEEDKEKDIDIDDMNEHDNVKS